jgi:hypothetical protein
MGDADATLLFTAHANAHANTRVPGRGLEGRSYPAWAVHQGRCVSVWDGCAYVG